MVYLAEWSPWSLLGSSKVTGHKLRLNITDTAVIQDSLLKAWLYTDTRTGVVQSTPGSSLSCGALLQKLQSQHGPYEHENPCGWVALAHFSNHVTRLITAQELGELLTGVYVGVVPEAVGAAEAVASDEPWPKLLALQGYITPVDDVRYITTFGGIEGSTIFTQARTYSDRFAAGPSRAAAAQIAASVVQQALTAAAAGAAKRGSQEQQVTNDDPNHIVGNDSLLESHINSGLASSKAGYMHSDVMLQAAAVTSQDGCATPTMLVAAAHWRNSVCSEGEAIGSIRLYDANETGHGTRSSSPGLQLAAGSAANEPTQTSAAGSDADGLATFRVQSAPQAVSKAAAAAVQMLLSHLDKAYGLRVAGLAAEFVLDNRQQLWLTGLNSITLDPQQSKGSSATFTERWTEFLAGVGPPPAPHLAQHTKFAATAAAAASPKGGLGMADRYAGAAKGRAVSPKPSSGVFNNPSSPLLSVELADLPCPRPQSAEPSNKAVRPTSAPRSLRSPSPKPASPSSASPSRQRTGSFTSSTDLGSPTGSLPLSRNMQGGAPKNTSRNAASAARPGAGGNPTARPGTCDSYSLWLQQPVRPGDSITAQLAGQLEWAKEQVQQYADLAEAARLQSQEVTQQAARQVSSVQQELLQLRHDAAEASRERRHLQQQVAGLEHQRNSTQQGMAQLHQQFTALQEELSQDRATMAAVLRQHQQQKQQYDEEMTGLQQQNAELHHSCQRLTNRLGEESEVVSALRAQLVDYKLQIEQMNLQAKKSRSLNTNDSSMAVRRGGASTPPLQQVGHSMAGALSSSGLGAGMSGELTSMARGNSSRGLSNGVSTPTSISFGPSVLGVGSKQEQCLRFNKGIGSNPGSMRATEEYILASAGASQAATAAGAEEAGSGHSVARAADGKDWLAAAANTTSSSFGQAAGTEFGASNNSGPLPGFHAAEQLQQHQQAPAVNPSQPKQPKLCDISNPDAAIASITSALSADTGEQLVAGGRLKPQLFIADLLSDSRGNLEKTAEQQLAVLSGLMQEIHGDLLEIYGYYATLGGVLVVADRMTMDLLQFGKLAYHLHIAQDNKSLSAVEDAFFMMSDRRPCLALQNRVRPPTADATHRSDRLGGRLGSSPDCTITEAAAAAAAESGTAYLGPGTQHAIAHAVARNKTSGGTSGRTGNTAGTDSAAATAAAVMASVLGPDVIVPEQFAEALIRLACVRYRWGAVGSEYDWDSDDDDDDGEFEQAVQDHLASLPAGSVRMQRLKQLRQQQEEKRRGPRVLRPEGKDLYTGSPPVAMKATEAIARNGEPTSPGHYNDADYPMPSAADNLLTVVKAFLQTEVLKHARRNKLAGSPLGHRRARSKLPSASGAWRTAPR